jgi:malonate transporter
MREIAAIVLPVFGIIALGYVVAWRGIIPERMGEGLSAFVFTIAIPAYLFRTMLTSTLPAAIPWEYWAVYFGGLGLVWAATQIAVSRVTGETREGILAGFTAVQGNIVLIGIPLAIEAFGDAAAIPIALIVGFNSPVLMTLATLLLEGSRRSSGSGRAAAVSFARSVATNPIVMAILIGLAGNGLGLVLPGPVDGMIEMLGRAGPPGALFALGLAMRQYGLGGRPVLIGALCLIKLVLAPALVYLLATRVFALPPAFTGVAVLFAAMPVGINVYLFAMRYQSGIALASGAIAITTALGVVTTAFWLWVLGVG